MKKIYVKPLVEETKMESLSGIMLGVSERGQMRPEDAMARRHDMVIIDEEDEEELEAAEKAATPKMFHSNDYLKKVWD